MVPHGKPTLLTQYCATLGDAVLRHRTSVAEQSARIEAELANRVKSQFIANMSHELRTPLNAIIGFSKLIAEQGPQPLGTQETAEYANLIRDAAQHLLGVINGILDISKIQSGKFVLDMREVALDELMQAVIASFKLMARDGDIRLTLEADDPLPLIGGDAVKLRQVFTNLISNALKFTPAGGEVRVDLTAEPDGSVRAVVKDSGIGMTPDEIRVALTPFGQVDSGRTRWREGTGLGLPIAKSLVQLHGGKFRLESDKGVGTRIIMDFPPHAAQAAAGEAS